MMLSSSENLGFVKTLTDWNALGHAAGVVAVSCTPGVKVRKGIGRHEANIGNTTKSTDAVENVGL